MSTRSSPARRRSRWSTSSPTRTCPGHATRSAARTSRSCSAAGITVISTLNIQHLESVNDVVEQITGVKQRETIPDAIVRRADQVELVDMAPEALRRRMAHGNIYPPERVDAALGNYFRPATWRLCVSWRCCGSRIESRRASRTTATGTGSTAPGRRANGSSSRSRLGGRRSSDPSGSAHGGPRARGSHRRSRCVVDGRAAGPRAALERQKLLVEELGGTVKEVAGDDVGETLVAAGEVPQRHPDRARLDAALTLCAAHARIRDQSGHPCLGDRHRRPRDRPRGDRSVDRATATAAPPRGAAEEKGRPGVRSGRDRLAAADDSDRPASSPSGPPEHLAPLPSRRRSGLRRRRALAGTRRSVGGVPARELVLHASGAHLHDLRGRQLRGADRVPRRGCRRQRLRRARVAALCGRSTCASRERGPRPSRRLVERADPARDAAPRPRPPQRFTPSSSGDRLGGRGAPRRVRSRRRRDLRSESHSTISTSSLCTAANSPATIGGFSMLSRPRSPPPSRSRSSRRRSARSARSWLRGMRVRPSSRRRDKDFWRPPTGCGGSSRKTRRPRTLWSSATAASTSRCSAGTSSISGGSRVGSCRSRSKTSRSRPYSWRQSPTDVSTPTGSRSMPPPSCLRSSADAALLRRALVEAIVEALDASPPDMRVRVIAGAVWPGVDVRIIDRRPQSRRPGKAATPGAGAFVAQAFVIAIRGQVEIDETPGGGTTLVIRLPAADPVTIPGTRA